MGCCVNKDALLRQAEEKQKAMEKTNETSDAKYAAYSEIRDDIRQNSP